MVSMPSGFIVRKFTQMFADIYKKFLLICVYLRDLRDETMN